MPERSTDWIKQDKFYIPARYPNGWISGTPSDYISKHAGLLTGL